MRCHHAPGLVSNKADWEQKARDYGAQTDGGEWIVVDYETVGGGPERIDRRKAEGRWQLC